jgi:hypothetical protein
MDPTTTASATGKSSRGKDQIHWSEGVWQALDHAVTEEMTRTRVAAKILPHVYVEKKQTNVPQDVVILPQTSAVPFDPAFSIDESATFRVQEYWTTFKLSVAQVEAEEHEEMMLNQQMASSQSQGHAATGHMSHHYRASTAVSLSLRTANLLAQAEDLILFNGQNAVQNSPLFQPPATRLVQFLDANLQNDLDLGLLNIGPNGNIPINSPTGPAGLTSTAQVIAVHPIVQGFEGSPPRYAENTLNAVATAFSELQALGHYEHYALVLHTIPYADLHQALATTLIEPVEPISHLIKAGIHGTGTLPPFTAAGAGLPVSIGPTPTPISNLFPATTGSPPNGVPNVLYTGVLVSLSGNTMDHVRGRMDENLDVAVNFNQKDANEAYRFRVAERFALRLKDPSAVILLLFMDS